MTTPTDRLGAVERWQRKKRNSQLTMQMWLREGQQAQPTGRANSRGFGGTANDDP
jgi:hypothetical protein